MINFTQKKFQSFIILLIVHTKQKSLLFLYTNRIIKIKKMKKKLKWKKSLHVNLVEKAHHPS